MEIRILQVISVLEICLRIAMAQMTAFVTGGVQVPIEMYPHVAQLTFLHNNVCGGSIIRPRIILTAAHCIVGAYSRIYFTVYVGSTKSSKGDKYKACKYLVHEGYNENRPLYYWFDIGLVLLNKEIKFSPRVQMIPIATNAKWMNQKYRMTVTGFGITSFPGRPSTKLKATKMTYVSPVVCNQTQTSDSIPMPVPNHMFCLIGKSWTSDCPGDSGSGIVWRGQIVGVVSTGREASCGSDIMPSMYTNVPYFKDWVDEKARDLEKIPTSYCKKIHNDKELIKQFYGIPNPKDS